MRGLTDAGFHSDEWGLYTRLHRDQTLRRATALREKYASRIVGRATMRERFGALAALRDESDRDLEGMSQLGHALQTADAMRRDGLDEDWIVLGLIHDLGKTLLDHGEAPEFVVGDTHPLGCAFSPNIRHAEPRRPTSWTASSGSSTAAFRRRSAGEPVTWHASATS